MPYPKKLLNEHEELVVDLHPHWWYFAEPAAALVGSIILGIVFLAIDVAGWLKTLALVIIGVSALWLLLRYMKWATTHFVVTSDRVIFRHGILAKSGIEIPLERVNSVHFNQSIFERVVGAGDLLIESGSEGGQQRFTDVKNPDKIQNEIHTQMERNENRMRTGTAATHVPPTHPVNDLTAGLERLEGLRDRGTISDEEFEAQRRRLLEG